MRIKDFEFNLRELADFESHQQPHTIMILDQAVFRLADLAPQIKGMHPWQHPDWGSRYSPSQQTEPVRVPLGYPVRDTNTL